MATDLTTELDIWFRDKDFSIPIDGFDKPRVFKSVKDFHSFILDEVEFWEKYENLSGYCRDICNFFRNNVLNHIINGVSYANSNQLSTASSHIDSAISIAISTHWQIIYSKSRLGKLVEQHLLLGTAEPIFEHLSSGRLYNHDLNYWSGLIEYVLTSNSKMKNVLNKSIKAEQAMIVDIRDQYLSEYEKIKEEHAVSQESTRTEVETFKNELNSWRETTTANVDMDLQIKDKEFGSTTNSYKTQFNELKERYENHISLKAPAEYWKTLKKNYFIQGWIWMGFTTISTIGFIAYLHFALNTITNWIAVGVDDAAWLQNLKSAFIFALIVSAGAFLIRQFVKLSMSAFHLSRDAEERLQLTTVYLSLLKEKGAVADSERSIILQSIFSRSDTGLLKGDSSPTMPSPVDVLMKNKPSA